MRLAESKVELDAIPKGTRAAVEKPESVAQK
jgi:hypothetical protein